MVLSDQAKRFRQACMEMNSVEELKEAAGQHTADKWDCEHWGITAQEWHDAVHAVLREKGLGAGSCVVDLHAGVGPRVLVRGDMRGEDIENALPYGWTVGENWHNGVRLSDGRMSYPLVKSTAR